MKPASVLCLGEGELEAEIVGAGEFGLRTARFTLARAAGVSAQLTGWATSVAHTSIAKMKPRIGNAIRLVFASRRERLPHYGGFAFHPRKFYRRFSRCWGSKSCELTLDVGPRYI